MSRPIFRPAPALIFAVALGACRTSGSGATTDPSPSPAPTPSTPANPTVVRFATYNVAMYRDQSGQLASDLADPTHPQALALAAVLQEIRPDVLLLNEVDHDDQGEAVRRLHDNFLATGARPLDYPHRFVPASNTGVASGSDLDGDGDAVTTPGSAAYAGDAYGYGLFPGQYGLAVLSTYPIGPARTFRQLRWADVPGSLLTPEVCDDACRAALRLSSKTHADLPVQIGDRTVHFLVSHPTPPVFDGPEDRNGRRNADEIGLWRHYIGDDGDANWLVDDDGARGGLGPGSFVIAGDLNADPADGDSRAGAISALLDHPRIADPRPASAGGTHYAEAQGGANSGHRTDPALDTSDFADTSTGNLRLDYVLPSADLTVVGSGVVWPLPGEALHAEVHDPPGAVSDHRLVWVDVAVGPG